MLVRSKSREEYVLDCGRNSASAVAIAGMAGITLLQALNNKNLIIVAEVGIPIELSVLGLFGKQALDNYRGYQEEPIPGMYDDHLHAQQIPDTNSLATQIGLDG